MNKVIIYSDDEREFINASDDLKYTPHAWGAKRFDTLEQAQAYAAKHIIAESLTFLQILTD